MPKMPKRFAKEPLIEFNPKLPKLSENESKVLKLLVEAAKLIVPIYKLQENQKPLEGIKKAAKKNPAILSPYTVIEEQNGKLVAIPYHVKYADLLKPIAEKLREAAKITENKEFGKALKIQAKVLLDGTYEQASAAWLKMEPYILDISIGPLHHYDDRLFFSKASYHAWVGVIDREGTDRLLNYKAVTLSVRRKTLSPKERIEPKKMKVKVLDVVIFSGIMARTKFVGLNLPIDTNFVEKYGADVTLFNQSNDLRFMEQVLPTFNQIFSKDFKQGFSEEDLRRGYLRYTALHELAHSYLYYKNAAKNLEDLFLCIYELAATILGLRLAGSLLLKDRITDKQLQSMIVAYTSRCIYLMKKGGNGRFMMKYVLGSTIFINFMLESGALRWIDNQIISNFTKIFVSLHDLSNILESLLIQGTRKDAESFINKYASDLS
ncbi:MAG: hypothetical protein PHE48_01585 [Candidatus Daviesbacteria bacterium]|nr:hypothetical protein [Candidatus Daviesbacteria bacterium]